MKIRIGTRASHLALVQSELVRSELQRLNDTLDLQLIHIQTLGDKRQGTAEEAVLDKKEWIVELEEALVGGEIDLAVHSGKDVPQDIRPETSLIPVLTRESAKDIFIGRNELTWQSLPAGAIVGTASARRKAQLLHLRPDLRVVEHRGNVPTRLAKLRDSNELSGIVLALAGVQRLQLLPHVKHEFSPQDMVPAMNQGILVTQFRKQDLRLTKMIDQLSRKELYSVFQAERACIETLGADCHSAVGVYSETIGNSLSLHARVMSPDGSLIIEETRIAADVDPRLLGQEVGRCLIQRGASKLLQIK